ncbi:MAG: hypothetical protein VW082_00105 [Candidatus Nanopelagicales bacterium]
MTTTTPFDDPIAFDERWPRNDEVRNARADEDPLLFVADHVMLADRCPGSLAIHAEFSDGSPSAMIVISDAPEDCPEEERRTFLGNVAQVLSISAPIAGLGLVHHRMGPSSITESDAEWSRILQQTCEQVDANYVGVIARTYSGSIVRL